MMHILPLYLLKVNLAILIFYGFYHLFLRKKTFFQINRFYLLYTMVISFVLPLTPSPYSPTSTQKTKGLIQSFAGPMNQEAWNWQYQNFIPLQHQSVIHTITIGDLFLMIYCSGVIFLGVIFLRRLFNLFGVIRESRKMIRDEAKYLIHPKVPISSFFTYLFWDGQTNNQLLFEHEKVHMHQWHSSDVILTEICKIILWFNPVIYRILSELRLLHEFIADKIVIKKSGDKSSYIQLMQEHSAAPTPILSHHFNSFLKNRLVMLYKKRSSPYFYINFIIFIPLFIGIAILIMAPGSQSLISQVEDKWDELEGKAVVSLPFDKPDLSNTIYLQWGKNQYPLREVSRIPNYYYRLDSDIEKADFLKNLESSLKLIDPSNDTPINMETYGIYFRSLDHSVIRIQTEGTDLNPWQSFKDIYKRNQEIVKDGFRFTFLINKGTKTYNGSLTIKDDDTRQQYLKLGSRRYLIESDLGHSSPNFYPNNCNQVTPKELVTILEEYQYEVIDDNQQIAILDTKFYYADNLNRSLDKAKLASKVRKTKKIDKPVLMILNVASDKYFAVLFNGDKQVIVRLKTWDEYIDQPLFQHIRNVIIEEENSMEWGVLDLQTPGSEDDGRYLIKNPESIFLEKQGWSVPVSTIKNILTKIPSVHCNHSQVAHFSIFFRFIDHKNLPFECRLDYADGQLVGGQEFIEAIMERAKPNDFIHNLSVSSGTRKLISGGTQIRLK